MGLYFFVSFLWRAAVSCGKLVGMTTTDASYETVMLRGDQLIPVNVTDTGVGTVRINHILPTPTARAQRTPRTAAHLPIIGKTGWVTQAHGMGRVAAHSGPRSFVVRYPDGHTVTHRI